MDRPDPLRLGKYRVLEAVARGPIAEVLKARLDGIAGFSRLFAIKRIHEHVAADPDRLARIEAEARRVAVLSHGNVVQLLDLGRDEAGRPYLVLEWVDGWSLADVLAKAREAGTPIPPPHAAWIALQVLNALEVAHGHREITDGADGADVELPIVHGALVAEDVLLSRGGEVKVSDFGLARIATLLASEEPALLPGARPAGDQSVQGDLRALAAILHASLTLSSTSSSLAGRDGVAAPLAAAIDALLGVQGADASVAPTTASAFKTVVTDALHGQVFTQEVLAAWVNGLFGIGDVVADGLRLDDEAHDDLLGEEVGVDLDLPDLPARDDWTASEEDAAGGRTMLDEDDDVRTVAQGDHVAAPKGSTAAAGRTGSVRTGAIRPADPWDPPAAAVVDPDLAARLAALRTVQPASTEPAEDEIEVPRGRPWVGGALAAVVLLALGGGLGAVGTTLLAKGSPLLLPTPVLDLRVPTGVSVEVDGAPFDGPARLAAGSHGVEVRVDGRDPWTFDLVLQDGEYRVIVVDADRQKVASSEAAAPE